MRKRNTTYSYNVGHNVITYPKTDKEMYLGNIASDYVRRGYAYFVVDTDGRIRSYGKTHDDANDEEWRLSKRYGGLKVMMWKDYITEFVHGGDPNPERHIDERRRKKKKVNPYDYDFDI